MKVKVLINPKAGRGRGQVVQAAIEQELINRKIDYVLETTQVNQEKVVEQTQSCINGNYDLIIVAGGDGTINQVVNGIAGYNIPLGVIPCGTGNDFAAALGMPRDPVAALLEILAGEQRHIDLCKVNDRYYVGTVGAGFDGQVAYTVNHHFSFMRGMIVYLLGVFWSMVSFKNYPFRITIDGKSQDFKGILVAINNAKTYGGGIPITPQAKIDDGLLAICTGRAMNRLELLWNLPKLLQGTHTPLKESEVASGPECCIRKQGTILLSG